MKYPHIAELDKLLDDYATKVGLSPIYGPVDKYGVREWSWFIADFTVMGDASTLQVAATSSIGAWDKGEESIALEGMAQITSDVGATRSMVGRVEVVGGIWDSDNASRIFRLVEQCTERGNLILSQVQHSIEQGIEYQFDQRFLPSRINGGSSASTVTHTPASPA